MALTESAGAAWTAVSTGNAQSAASFTPAANALVVAVVSVGNGNGIAGTSITITSTFGGTCTNTWVLVKDYLPTAAAGGGGIWVMDAGSAPGAGVVTATALPSGVLDVALIVRQFAGALPAASQTGVGATHAGVVDTVSVTPGTTGSQIVGALAAVTAVTANGATTLYGSTAGTHGDWLAAFKASSLSTSGTPQVLGATNTQAHFALVAAEILPASAETSPGLEVSGFTIVGPGPADTINSVTVAVTEHQSNTAQAACTFELWDYSGTPAQIGTTQTGTASTSTSNVSTATFTGVTYAQLATLRVRVYGHANSGTSYVESVDGVSLVVSYTVAPQYGTASAAGAGAVTATGHDPAAFLRIQPGIPVPGRRRRPARARAGPSGQPGAGITPQATVLAVRLADASAGTDSLALPGSQAAGPPPPWTNLPAQVTTGGNQDIFPAVSGYQAVSADGQFAYAGSLTQSGAGHSGCVATFTFAGARPDSIGPPPPWTNLPSQDPLGGSGTGGYAATYAATYPAASSTGNYYPGVSGYQAVSAAGQFTYSGSLSVAETGHSGCVATFTYTGARASAAGPPAPWTDLPAQAALGGDGHHYPGISGYQAVSATGEFAYAGSLSIAESGHSACVATFTYAGARVAATGPPAPWTDLPAQDPLGGDGNQYPGVSGYQAVSAAGQFSYAGSLTAAETGHSGCVATFTYAGARASATGPPAPWSDLPAQAALGGDGNHYPAVSGYRTVHATGQFTYSGSLSAAEAGHSAAVATFTYPAGARAAAAGPPPPWTDLPAQDPLGGDGNFYPAVSGYQAVSVTGQFTYAGSLSFAETGHSAAVATFILPVGGGTGTTTPSDQAAAADHLTVQAASIPAAVIRAPAVPPPPPPPPIRAQVITWAAPAIAPQDRAGAAETIQVGAVTAAPADTAAAAEAFIAGIMPPDQGAAADTLSAAASVSFAAVTVVAPVLDEGGGLVLDEGGGLVGGEDSQSAPAEAAGAADQLAVAGVASVAFTDGGAAADRLHTAGLTEADAAAAADTLTAAVTVHVADRAAAADATGTEPAIGASGGATIPRAAPGTSQVAVAAPGTTRWIYLGSIGQVTALKYSFTCPGGADQMTCTVMVPASYRNQAFSPGWQVRVTRGGHTIWTGKMDEPVPTASGWTFTAVGNGMRGADFLAIYSDTWPANQPDESINGAISRGLPWVNPGVGQPAGAWFGQGVDSGAQTITALLNLICTRGAMTWYVNSQPGGMPGDDLTVFPLPTTPSRLLVAVTPVPRTLGGDINTIYLRYQITADNTSAATPGTAPATYGLAVAQNAQSVAMHGELETYIDISDVGVMTQAAAQAVGQKVLALYQRASFAGPFVGSYGQLMNLGGTPIDPGTDQAGTVVRLILTDFGYGGELVPGPIQFIVGSYEWDDFAGTFTLSAMNTLDHSLTGMLQMENTVMVPVTVASRP